MKVSWNRYASLSVSGYLLALSMVDRVWKWSSALARLQRFADVVDELRGSNLDGSC